MNTCPRIGLLREDEDGLEPQGKAVAMVAQAHYLADRYADMAERNRRVFVLVSSDIHPGAAPMF